MPYPNEPVDSVIGGRLRERTQAMAPNDGSYGYAHAWLCNALGAAYEQVQEVFDPEDPIPPLAPILDPDLCPDWALPWLAQLVGIRLAAGTDPDTARTIIKEVDGFQRGTPASLAAAAGLYLTGNRTVYFRERDGDPYVLEVVTLEGETPDIEAVRRALLAQKPGGIVLNYRIVLGWDYQAMTDEGGTYAELAAAFVNYRSLQDNERI